MPGATRAHACYCGAGRNPDSCMRLWCRAQPGLMHAIVVPGATRLMHAIGWKLLSEATTRFPWLSSRPPIRKNNSEKTHRIPAGTRKGHHQTGRHWIRTNADNHTATPQDEREPRKSRKTPHLGQISTGVQVTYILLCSKGKPHWCCCCKGRKKEAVSW